MKLLKLEIGDLPKEKQFRSLHAGFKVEFHNYDTDKGIKAMEFFSPFCFAGLNGSGKSNVLEALANIFYHLECCVAKFKPKTFATYFRAAECNPDAFTLEYLIGQHNSKPYALAYFDKIIIKKEKDKTPLMWRQSFPFTKEEELIPVSLIPKVDLREPQAAEGKEYLPQIIVGYSSGENEILSLPFRKSRLINLDKYREDYIKGYRYEEPENSLIYIDAEMSQAVLLVCLLYEDEETLKPLRQELGILELSSFRMNFNYRVYMGGSRKTPNHFDPLIFHIENHIENLKACSSSWQQFEEYTGDSDGGYDDINLILDFFITKETISAFKNYFSTSFDLFRFFQVLYELNAGNVSNYLKEEVYKSKGLYTDWKLPKNSPRDNIFFFEDYYILKQIGDQLEPKTLLLREFSDGEHQFLHTMGICLMLKDRKSILLLDEPETHFNPSWRAKFVKILDDSIKAGNYNEHPNGSFNVNSLKDILLTSHSPFIISDCMPDNVLFFSRNEQSKLVEAKKASELGLKTYGSSVDYILKNFFKTNLISNKSFEELKDIIDHGTIDELRKAVEDFGESSEKQFLFRKIYEKMENKNDNKAQ
jgi:restriction system-associated AAA family ATPase